MLIWLISSCNDCVETFNLLGYLVSLFGQSLERLFQTLNLSIQRIFPFVLMNFAAVDGNAQGTHGELNIVRGRAGRRAFAQIDVDAADFAGLRGFTDRQASRLEGTTWLEVEEGTLALGLTKPPVEARDRRKPKRAPQYPAAVAARQDPASPSPPRS